MLVTSGLRQGETRDGPGCREAGPIDPRSRLRPFRRAGTILGSGSEGLVYPELKIVMAAGNDSSGEVAMNKRIAEKCLGDTRRWSQEKFYPVSTQLRGWKRQNRETVRVEVFRNGRSRRDCCLYSIDAQFPKLDVAGSIPVSRSCVSITCLHSSRLNFSLNDVGKMVTSRKCKIFREIGRHECQRDTLAFRNLSQSTQTGMG
jgi:hypothetical protein